MNTSRLIPYKVAFIAGITLASCASHQGEYNIVPQPVVLKQHSGFFNITENTSVAVNSGTERVDSIINGLLDTYIDSRYGVVVQRDKSNNPVIEFNIDKTINKEIGAKDGYIVKVTGKHVLVSSSTDTGLFYGLQTLFQLMEADGIPQCEIKDYPRFNYRGMHLDVSRNFFPKEFIFKMLDAMSYYKLNKFHWHLTDGAGWRIEIDQYPELTNKAAYRKGDTWKEWSTTGGKYSDSKDSTASGAYYAKEDVREVVKYAQDRFIEVIPEIEMPGHSEEVFWAYPEYNCEGKPYTSSDFCIGNEGSFVFLQNILDEVIELFPSQYVHIGGDEAAKGGWKKCKKCQKRMKDEGLNNLDELQSYMIKRIENYLISKNKQLLGWDEIVEGGLAPEATVMSWRDSTFAITALKDGHDVIMTPGGYYYFDHYQAVPFEQPEAIGGYSPLKKVYSYNPTFAGLTSEQLNHIIGVQANVWTEYIPTQEHAEYMIFPRILAVAETGWTPDSLKNWEDFKKRANHHIGYLQTKGINTFPLTDDIEVITSRDSVNNSLVVTLDAEKYPVDIRYTVDGTETTNASDLYITDIVVKDSALLVASLFGEKVDSTKFTRKRIDNHKAIGKKVTYLTPINKSYPSTGENALVDGRKGGFGYNDGIWQGYTNDLEIVIDLEKEQKIHRIFGNFMQLIGPDVFLPASLELYASIDGKEFTQFANVTHEVSLDDPLLIIKEMGWDGNINTRYIKVVAKQSEKKGFIFADEIVVW